MLASLRSRLWLSYALVISAALGVVFIALIIYILRNPLVYRQEAARLLVVQNLIIRNRENWTNLRPEAIQSYFDQQQEFLDARVILFNEERQLVADSGSQDYARLRLPRLARERMAGMIRGGDGIPWLYSLRRLENNYWLMVAVQRPDIALTTILRDDLLVPVIGAGFVALLLSLLLAYLLSKWVGDPLQRVLTASREMPDGNTDPLVVEGPREVQDLIRGFNAMSARIVTAQQSQRQFVADVSHELKTPITVIQGFAQAILDGTANSPELEKQAARVIYEESGRMQGLVLDLLDLARLDSGTLDLKHETVDMNLLIQHVVERFTPQTKKRQITMEFSPAAQPLIVGDSGRLSQVFMNLLDNAIKFTPDGGRVSVYAENDAKVLRIDISDTGSGISPEQIPHIFDRFYQADPSRKGGERHGAGLGLAIVKEFIQAHHGTITARSSPGQGSTFTVCLPLASSEASTISQRRKR
jgi:signal transduction histidine kinase